MSFLEDWFDEDERDHASNIMTDARKRLHETGYTFLRFKKEYREQFPDRHPNEDDLVELFDDCALTMYLTKGVDSFTDWIENLKHE